MADGNIQLKVDLIAEASQIKKDTDAIKKQTEDAFKPLKNTDKKTKKANLDFSKLSKGVVNSLKKIKSMILGTFIFSVVSKSIQSVNAYYKFCNNFYNIT